MGVGCSSLKGIDVAGNERKPAVIYMENAEESDPDTSERNASAANPTRALWNDMPDIILGHVLDKLNWRGDVSSSLRLVCKSWHMKHDSLLSKIPPALELRSLRFEGKGVADVFPNIRELDLTARLLTDFDLPALRGLSNLTAVSLFANSPESFALLRTLPSLSSLNIQGYNGAKVSSVALRAISAKTSLKELCCISCFTDNGLRFLSNLQLLNLLELPYCRQITDYGLRELSVLTGLTYLNLKRCREVSDFGLAALSTLSRLTYLNLGACDKITISGLAFLAETVPLQELDLTEFAGSYIEKESSSCSLCKLTSLTSLNVSNTREMNGKVLRSLCTMTQLKILDLCDCAPISEDSLCNLSELSGLTSLNLGDCQNTTDIVLNELSNLSELVNLNIFGCYKVTDEGLSHLCALTSLTSLDICTCKYVSKSGLRTLSFLPRIKMVNTCGGCIRNKSFCPTYVSVNMTDDL
mmetsp:Transcript_15077/g.20806  ORF Transcript_15077/g.20806 Transcript_15077/m.20806 type:complete len:469 (-) Transcript_15077:151-1557(-)